jgi:hypothetical protein
MREKKPATMNLLHQFSIKFGYKISMVYNYGDSLHYRGIATLINPVIDQRACCASLGKKTTAASKRYGSASTAA